jgi:hypothetical protein
MTAIVTQIVRGRRYFFLILYDGFGENSYFMPLVFEFFMIFMFKVYISTIAYMSNKL